MYHKTVLKNGLRIVTHDMKERDSAAVSIWIGAGGRYEDDRIKGAAHFLEHIVFKGSQKYSCDEIKGQIEGVGGNLNAFTAEEQTCYYAKVPAKHVNRTFDVLADMVFHPLIPRSEVQKEKGVIIEEIKMYYDLPQYLVMDMLDELMWPNHPLGKKLTGTVESVSQMTKQDLNRFHRRHYCGGNIVVAACGNVRHQDFVRLVRTKAAKIPKGEVIDFTKADDSQDHPKVKFLRKDIEQMHLALGMLGLKDDHKDKYVLGLLHVILGGNMSSRLFDEVREKRGLAYSISSSVKSLQDTGMFMIRAGVDNKKIVKAVEVILKELTKIKDKGVLKDEFTRAKDYYLGQVLLGLEDSLEHMLWIGESMMSRNRLRTLKDVVEQVKKVKRDDIKRLARHILQENRFNLAIVGPLTDAQEKHLSRLIK